MAISIWLEPGLKNRWSDASILALHVNVGTDVLYMVTAQWAGIDFAYHRDGYLWKWKNLVCGMKLPSIWLKNLMC